MNTETQINWIETEWKDHLVAEKLGTGLLPYSKAPLYALKLLDKWAVWRTGKSYRGGTATFWCEIATEVDGDDIAQAENAEAPTLPEAICIAALRAAGVSIVYDAKAEGRE